MQNQNLTWAQIKQMYPHQNVGLTNVDMAPGSLVIRSGTVVCTDKDTDYNEMALMAMRGEIELRYTTMDEDSLEILEQ